MAPNNTPPPPSNAYCVTYNGELLEGTSRETARACLSASFGLSESEAERLINGRDVRIKQAVTQAVAERIRRTLLECGLVARVEAMGEVPEPLEAVPTPRGGAERGGPSSPADATRGWRRSARLLLYPLFGLFVVAAALQAWRLYNPPSEERVARMMEERGEAMARAARAEATSRSAPAAAPPAEPVAEPAVRPVAPVPPPVSLPVSPLAEPPTEIVLHALDAAAKAELEGYAGHGPLRVRITRGSLIVSAEDLRFLARFPEIVDLEIYPDRIDVTDLSPLAELTDLRRLSLRRLRPAGQVPVDLGPLAALTRLEALSLRSSRLEGFDALRGLAALRELNLNASGVNSVTFAEGMPRLRQLSLDECLVADYTPLRHLGALRTLDLDNCRVSSLAFLDGMPELEALSLKGRGHGFDDYAPLLRRSKLKRLNIDYHRQAIDDKLAVPSALHALREVEMSQLKGLTRLDFLAGSRELRRLAAGGSPRLKDISALAGMARLEQLNLRDTAITDLAVLADKRALRALYIQSTAVRDLAPLANLRALKELNLSRTGVSSLHPLKGAINLRSIWLYDTQVSDLSPLHGLSKLKSVTLSKGFSPPQVKALKEALPKVSVRFQ